MRLSRSFVREVVWRSINTQSLPRVNMSSEKLRIKNWNCYQKLRYLGVWEHFVFTEDEKLTTHY